MSLQALMSSPDRSRVLQQLEPRRILFGFQLVPAGQTVFGLLIVKELPRWLRSRGHINEAIARLAYICCLGLDYHHICPDMSETEAVIAEGHEGDVLHRCRDLPPPAVEWTEIGRLLRTAEIRRRYVPPRHCCS